jgi:hypothetical protein
MHQAATWVDAPWMQPETSRWSMVAQLMQHPDAIGQWDAAIKGCHDLLVQPSKH